MNSRKMTELLKVDVLFLKVCGNINKSATSILIFAVLYRTVNKDIFKKDYVSDKYFGFLNTIRQPKTFSNLVNESDLRKIKQNSLDFLT